MHRRILSALVVALLLVGCTHYNYSPNMVMVPYTTQKHEAVVGVNLGGELITSSMNIYAAYNPWKRITLSGSYYRYFDRYKTFSFAGPSDENSCLIQYGDMAASGWHQFDDERLRIGCLLGGGFGRVKNDYGFATVTQLNYNKVFLQPTFAYKGKYLRWGIGSRLSHLGYDKGSVNTGIPTEDLNALLLLDQNAPFLLMENGVDFGLNIKAVTMSWNLTVGQFLGATKSLDYNFDMAEVNFGLAFDLHQLFGKKQKTPKVLPTEN